MDCAEFVCRVHADDGLTDGVKHMNSRDILDSLNDKTMFENYSETSVGDVAVWEGHTGIVSEVDGSNI